jgi:hypothetical protein
LKAALSRFLTAGIITFMLTDLDLDQTMRVALMNLMVVLYQCGIKEIHIGGLMRIIGVSNETASLHDDECVVLDDKFVKYVEQVNEPRPIDQTLH